MKVEDGRARLTVRLYAIYTTTINFFVKRSVAEARRKIQERLKSFQLIPPANKE